MWTRLRESSRLPKGSARGPRRISANGCKRCIFKRAGEAGLRVREYAPPPGGGVSTVTAEDDIFVGRLARTKG